MRIFAIVAVLVAGAQGDTCTGLIGTVSGRIRSRIQLRTPQSGVATKLIRELNDAGTGGRCKEVCQASLQLVDRLEDAVLAKRAGDVIALLQKFKQHSWCSRNDGTLEYISSKSILDGYDLSVVLNLVDAPINRN